jgi:hypothetical protein
MYTARVLRVAECLVACKPALQLIAYLASPDFHKLHTQVTTYDGVLLPLLPLLLWNPFNSCRLRKRP